MNNMPPCDSVLVHAAQQLNAAGIRWAVFAGTAASLYGASRPVTDLDVLVPAAEVDRVTALFPEAQARQHPGCLVGLGLPGVDIVVGLSSMDLDPPMAIRLTHHPLHGTMLPVIPREDNILLKALLGRGPEQGKHDWADVEAMMAHAPSLDWNYIRWRSGTLRSPIDGSSILERLQALWLQVGDRQATDETYSSLEEKNDQA